MEATEALRGLIDAIILTPTDGELRIELKGNLAAMLSAATNAKRSPETGDLSLQVVWLRGRDLNPRPLGYEPNELPDCSTPRQLFWWAWVDSNYRPHAYQACALTN